MRRILGESRSARIEKRLKMITELYDLAYRADGVDDEIIQYKTKINFVSSEEGLIECCKQIAEQIARLELKSYGKMNVKQKVSISLREVFFQLKV